MAHCKPRGGGVYEWPDDRHLAEYTTQMLRAEVKYIHKRKVGLVWRDSLTEFAREGERIAKSIDMFVLRLGLVGVKVEGQTDVPEPPPHEQLCALVQKANAWKRRWDVGIFDHVLTRSPINPFLE